MKKKFLWFVLIAVLALNGVSASAKTFWANNYGAKGDGKTLDTEALQKAINDAAQEGGTVTMKPGVYLTGSLFVRSAVTLQIPEGVTLLGSQRAEDYPIQPTRIAGVEMSWPAALINVRDQSGVRILGKGMIDGDGAIWWKSYWDLRAIYEPRGLRWASDYDARRPRLMLVQNSTNVTIGGGLQLHRSGFWTIQVLYSQLIHIDGVVIRNNEGGKGPSTDGIDIDSSKKIVVEHADIDVNDDALCLKAGRDSDGLRVNQPTADVVIRDSVVRTGAAAITIGSETSGGFSNIEVYNITALSGVSSGVLFKSAHTRGGYAKDIRIHDLTLRDVATPVQINMNWNPTYSYATIPHVLEGKDIPSWWKVLATPVPADKGLPHFSDVHIWNIKATGAKKAFSVAAYPNATLDNFRLDHLDIDADTAGNVANVRNWTLTLSRIHAADGSSVTYNDSGEPKKEIAYGEPGSSSSSAPAPQSAAPVVKAPEPAPMDPAKIVASIPVAEKPALPAEKKAEPVVAAPVKPPVSAPAEVAPVEKPAVPVEKKPEPASVEPVSAPASSPVAQAPVEKAPAEKAPAEKPVVVEKKAESVVAEAAKVVASAPSAVATAEKTVAPAEKKAEHAVTEAASTTTAIPSATTSNDKTAVQTDPTATSHVRLPVKKNDKLPTIYLVGDSTVRNGKADGAGGQWGWGEPIVDYFDLSRVNVVNRAIGGRSSRTYMTEGRWDELVALLKQGDYVIIQFGHNDSGPLDDAARARGTIPGVGEQSKVINNPITGKQEEVHTYGWYIRKYVADAKSRGAIPIVCSPIPRKIWKDGKVVRSADSYGGWASMAAEAGEAFFINLNEIVARRYDKLGEAQVESFFADPHTHTSRSGAELNAESVVAGARALEGTPLDQYLSAKGKAIVPDSGR